jgi:flagellar assembly protein FliH
MKFLSNIIRGNQLSQVPKKIIHIKKIENKRLDLNDSEIDQAQKKNSLLEEIKTLENEYQQLQEQIMHDQKNARTEIANWCDNQKEEANLNAKRLAEEASAEGFKAGYSMGVDQAEEEFRGQRLEMQELIQLAYEEKTKIVQQSESFLLSLSIKIAEKVIKEELKQHNDQLLNVVKQALKHIEESEDVVMQVSPDDYPIVLPFLDELQTYVRDDSELKLIPIANLKKGGCMIQTANGSYDVTVDGQLQEIKTQLLIYCEESAD